ncbi:unnamed protein product [Pleuronectes platessa]|uniref:Uncharacterized protein n=1 Tax=Pleuronectes platessa TaxID=8262 RepID=A0A9N7YRG4_PLEPL|nr:unnamed protein product [Pleuronectes platessa]
MRHRPEASAVARLSDLKEAQLRSLVQNQPVALTPQTSFSFLPHPTLPCSPPPPLPFPAPLPSSRVVFQPWAPVQAPLLLTHFPCFALRDTFPAVHLRTKTSQQLVGTGQDSHPQPKHTHCTMSDSETAAAPVEAPVPAVCAGIKADLDKCVAEKGVEGCQDLLEAFAACVKSAAEASS